MFDVSVRQVGTKVVLACNPKSVKTIKRKGGKNRYVQKHKQ